MKVLMVNSYYYPYSNGGAEIVCRTVSEKLVQKGHVVHILTLDNHYHKEYINGVEATYLDTFIGKYRNKAYQKKWMRMLIRLFRLLDIISYSRYKKLIKENYDIINTHAIEDISPSIWMAAQKMHIPVVHMMHDKYMLCPRLFMLKGNKSDCISPRFLCRMRTDIYRKLGKVVKCYIAPSYACAKSMPFDSIVIHNGVEIQRKEKQKTFPDDRPFRFIFVGGVSYHKGILILLSAFAKIKDDSELYIVGDGSQLTKVKEAAQVDFRIKYWGQQGHDKTLEIISMCDCLILPSLCAENCPMVVLEAYSRGIPVIGSNIGGIPELVEDGITGFLTSVGQDIDLYKKMLKIKQKDIWEKMENNILQRIADYDIDTQVEKIERLLLKFSEKN